MESIFNKFGFTFTSVIENEVFIYSKKIEKGTYRNGYKNGTAYLIYRPNFNNSLTINFITETPTKLYDATNIHKSNNYEFCGIIPKNKIDKDDFLEKILTSLELND